MLADDVLRAMDDRRCMLTVAEMIAMKAMMAMIANRTWRRGSDELIGAKMRTKGEACAWRVLVVCANQI